MNTICISACLCMYDIKIEKKTLQLYYNVKGHALLGL